MKKLWFKAKCYGWGWYPSSWQGFLITMIFIAWMIYAAYLLLEKGKIIEYFLALTISVLALIYIAYKTGERPRWRWGK